MNKSSKLFPSLLHPKGILSNNGKLSEISLNHSKTNFLSTIKRNYSLSICQANSFWQQCNSISTREQFTLHFLQKSFQHSPFSTKSHISKPCCGDHSNIQDSRYFHQHTSCVDSGNSNAPPKQRDRPVVTRFAPSPTGFLHLGSIRTALFNFLHARRHNGKFILRIEDTDQNRIVPGAVEHIIDTLGWLNLSYDEFHVQSKRQERYHEVAEHLVKEGFAYRCYCSRERLEQFKYEKYDRKCMHLSESEQKTFLDQGIKPTIRLILPREGYLKVHDDIFGDMQFDYDLYDDCIIMKSDGMPTYHLANVIDDHDMGVTHCIRGMEWLSSLPRHIQLYDSMNWEKPTWMHLPLLYNDDGVKLSKRHGHSNIEWYREIGYLPEALLNFLMFHGWMHHANAGKEILTLPDMISLYDEVHLKSKSKMLNIPTLDDINSQHVQRLIETDVSKVLSFVLPQVKKLDSNINEVYLQRVLLLAKDRIHVLDRFADRFSYYFTDDIKPSDSFTVTLHKSVNKENQIKVLKYMIEKLESLQDPTPDEVQVIINQGKKDLNISFKNVMTVLRYYITAQDVGPYIKDTIVTLGVQKSIKRLQSGLFTLENDINSDNLSSTSDNDSF